MPRGRRTLDRLWPSRPATAPAGPTWFILEKGAEGFSHGKPEDKHGLRISNTAALSLSDVYVPVENLVGGVEGQGLLQAQLVFGYTRLMVAAFGLGAGWAALDRAIPYSKDRLQGGAPLSEKQGYTHKLIVPHAVRLEAGRAYIEETAERLDAGEEMLNTEGAIAKYLATEAGLAAAEASIQALGGYGYTREYMVEKIRRDVRITTIYEGTSEIMEMTIARDRWQQHLKTRGQHYHDKAREMEALEAAQPGCGARFAALALHSLAEGLERFRAQRLTRHQHVLFRAGRMIALAEGAMVLAKRAAAAAKGELSDKADRRFDTAALAAVSRANGREAAFEVAQEALRWAVGADGVPATDLAAFTAAIRLPEISGAQAGLMTDLDLVSEARQEEPLEARLQRVALPLARALLARRVDVVDEGEELVGADADPPREDVLGVGEAGGALLRHGGSEASHAASGRSIPVRRGEVPAAADRPVLPLE